MEQIGDGVLSQMDIVPLPSPQIIEVEVLATPPEKGKDLKQTLVSGFYSFLSCIFESSKKEEAECEIVYDDIRQIKYIGSGAHGCVFLGEYNSKTVAVKKLKELNMTLREMRHLRELKHENIIGFLGVCIRPPNYGIVMEYCPRSLIEEIRDRPIPPELVLNWGAQIARGMEYLHKRNFIHRDLKSPNILITALDVLKISDFGTLREFSGHSEKLSFAGTAAWMAPEIIRNEDCSEKVDVWSYGVVLWELLTGNVPYRGVEEAAVVYGVGSNRLHLPVPTGVPDGFSLLLKQCFNFTPKHRPHFRQILLHLDILAADPSFISTPHKTYFACQADWTAQIVAHFEEMRKKNLEIPDVDLMHKRDEELKEAQRARKEYEEGLEKTNVMMRQLAQLQSTLLGRAKAARPGRAVAAGRSRHKRSSSGSSTGKPVVRREGLRVRQSSSDAQASASAASSDDDGDDDSEAT